MQQDNGRIFLPKFKFAAAMVSEIIYTSILLLMNLNLEIPEVVFFLRSCHIIIIIVCVRIFVSMCLHLAVEIFGMSIQWNLYYGPPN